MIAALIRLLAVFVWVLGGVVLFLLLSHPAAAQRLDARDLGPVEPPGAVVDGVRYPFALPPFVHDGKHLNIKANHDLFVPPQRPDAEVLFRLVLVCYPERSWFRPEVTASGRFGKRIVDSNAPAGDADTFSTGAALTLSVPLYSAAETERERRFEVQRRTLIAQSVGEWEKGVIDRGNASRELELARVIEARSRSRVAIAVADTAEQIEAMKKVAEALAAQTSAAAAVSRSRLVLLGMCTDSKDSAVREFLDFWGK